MAHGIEKIYAKTYHQHDVKHNEGVIFNHQSKSYGKSKICEYDSFRPSFPINFLNDVLVFAKRFCALDDAEFWCTYKAGFLSTETLNYSYAVVKTKSHGDSHENRK